MYSRLLFAIFFYTKDMVEDNFLDECVSIIGIEQIQKMKNYLKIDYGAESFYKHCEHILEAINFILIYAPKDSDIYQMIDDQDLQDSLILMLRTGKSELITICYEIA
jgi:broad-specificity NMP kinase